MATPQYFIPKDIVEELTKFRQSTVYLLMVDMPQQAARYVHVHSHVVGTYSSLELAMMGYLEYYGSNSAILCTEHIDPFINKYDGSKWHYATKVLIYSDIYDETFVVNRSPTVPLHFMPYYIIETRLNTTHSYIQYRQGPFYSFLDGKLVKTIKCDNPRKHIRISRDNPQWRDPNFVPPTFPALERFDFSQFPTD